MKLTAGVPCPPTGPVAVGVIASWFVVAKVVVIVGRPSVWTQSKSPDPTAEVVVGTLPEALAIGVLEGAPVSELRPVTVAVGVAIDEANDMATDATRPVAPEETASVAIDETTPVDASAIESGAAESEPEAFCLRSMPALTCWARRGTAARSTLAGIILHSCGKCTRRASGAHIPLNSVHS